ncbi:MAG TPA: APC family permease [Caproiciproducens sp.]|nr:APC family permease [Caproiciproducens sp.]
MFKKIKSIVIGEAIKSADSETQKFSVIWGLPVLSSDAISSVAYACEEILLVLVPVIGIASYGPLMGIAAAIVGLLIILSFSYRQTIDCYPHGGGSYSVASDNLGRVPGLVAAASLSIDYVLTVAVSTCSGTAAITSAFPALLPYNVEITILLIVLLTLGNLRGIRESSILFGIPTYLFIFSIISMIVTGLVRVFIFKQVPPPPAAMQQQVQDITVFLILRAFSSGCTALTGVEAVSNGIPNFRAPSQKNAKKVLVLLASLVLSIFVGVCYLASIYKIAPVKDVTVVAQIATRVFGQNSFMFFVVQVTTAMILFMAANTAFADLPLLLSLLAKDGFVARSFGSRGTRLSFSNGILLLFCLSSLLVIVFKAETHLLIPLYAVGVFLSFTLSQSGMFKKWMTHRQGAWRHKAFINGFGALTTAVTCVILAVTKFLLGAWIVLICIPTLVLMMILIRRHYDRVRDNLVIHESGNELVRNNPTENYIVLPVQSINKSFIKALNYSMTLGGKIEIYHVSTDPKATEKLKMQYEQLKVDYPLLIEEAPYRNVNEMLIKHVDSRLAELEKHEMLTVVLPQFVIPKVWHYLLHNQTSFRLRSALLKRRDIAVISIPYIINE